MADPDKPTPPGGSFALAWILIGLGCGIAGSLITWLVLTLTRAVP